MFEYVAWAGHNKTMDMYTGCPNTTEGEKLRYQGNMINGTDGRQFPPLLPEDAILQVFAEDIYRSGVLVPSGPSSFHGVCVLISLCRRRCSFALRCITIVYLVPAHMPRTYQAGPRPTPPATTFSSSSAVPCMLDAPYTRIPPPHYNSNNNNSNDSNKTSTSITKTAISY